MEIFKKFLKRKKENISNKSKEEELVSVEFFIKPWLYKINFTFADKNNFIQPWFYKKFNTY